LRLYRQAGLEYVDIIRAQAEKQTALSRQLGDIRLQLMQARADQAALEKFDQFANKFSDTREQLNGLLSDATDQAQALRETMLQLDSHAGASVIERESQDEARPVAATPAGNEAEQMATLRSATDKFAQIADSMKLQINQLLTAAPALTNVKVRKVFENWKAEVEAYLKQLPTVVEKLRAWEPNKPVPAYRAITSFLFGTQWITASFWQDWYGIIPLFMGSLLVSLVALLIGVPLGLCGAIYVSEVASPIEKSLIKPYIEFISAIPSVVLGFFGIAILGETIRDISRASFMQWVPFFPISERLNVFTAGCLLALMAVPTILLSLKMRCATYLAVLRKLPTHWARIDFRRSCACSCRRRCRGSCLQCCSGSAASSEKQWWYCYAQETGSLFRISHRGSGHFSSRCTP
jgi:phosphate transport system permease protein